jgi:SAM-dependent methyltransferase
MDEAAERHAEQTAYWGGPGAVPWVARQRETDRVLAGIARRVVDAADPRPGERVLDIGCGCGATTELLAARVGATGHVTGLDISGPMLAQAAARPGLPAWIDWLLADGATYDFGAGGFDLLFSRFGVMFFGDPDSAFGNLRRALIPGGRLAFVCWRKPAENPWMMVPLEAAYAHVPRLPKPGPEDPGPFAFADPARIARILTAGGFGGIAIEPVDLVLDLAGGGGLEAGVDQALQIGATGRALQGQDPEMRPLVAEAVRRALMPHLRDGRVELGAGVWIVRARAA